MNASRILPASALVALLAFAGCSSMTGRSGPLPSAPSTGSAIADARSKAAKKIKHVVVIIQENRSVDNLFNGFCVNATICADTVTVDPVTGTPLQAASLGAQFDPNHAHSQFVTEYDNGKMDGFPKESIADCQKPCQYTAFSYVPSSETTVYQQIATLDGLLSDQTFETLQGPSLPAHLYAIAGQSGGYDDDHLALAGGSGSCATKTLNAPSIDMTTNYPGKAGPKTPPCKDFQTIFDLLSAAGHTWRYYAHSSSGFMEGPQSIQHLYQSQNFITPETTVLADIANNQLPDVAFVTPAGSDSDHPTWEKDPKAGGAWVGSIVNAIGTTAYWDNTAIVIWWDDWGGFFDHVRPPVGPLPSWGGNPNPFEYGFRVPLIVVSPYARVGAIDHTPRTFVSALRLIEEVFGLPSLATVDQDEPDGLDSMFDFKQKRRPFTPVGGSSARPFIHR